MYIRDVDDSMRMETQEKITKLYFSSIENFNTSKMQ